jgi:hypothetical protein
MRIKIKKTDATNAWYMRAYLVGRTCKVLAMQIRQTKRNKPAYKAYFVLHPMTKKTGYWVVEKHCVIVEQSKVPTWDKFLKNNDYGYSRGQATIPSTV